MAKKKKTVAQLKKQLERVFNAYIRQRDDGKPCISCGQFKPLEAGHYYPVNGYDALRFNEDNVHGECHYCNCFDDGHLIGYTRNIKERIGAIAVEDLRQKADNYKKNGYKFTRAELIEKIEHYKGLLT